MISRVLTFGKGNTKVGLVSWCPLLAMIIWQCRQADGEGWCFFSSPRCPLSHSASNIHNLLHLLHCPVFFHKVQSQKTKSGSFKWLVKKCQNMSLRCTSMVNYIHLLVFKYFPKQVPFKICCEVWNNALQIRKVFSNALKGDCMLFMICYEVKK